VIDTTLASYATVRELEYLEAVDKHGSQRAAARALKVDGKTLRAALARVKARAAAKGYSPEHDLTRTVPDGYKVKGVSSLYVDGKLSSQWVKSVQDEDRREQMLREFADGLAQSVKGLAPVSTSPAYSNDALLCVYPWGDPHFGMYAWWQDAGADFDLDIAERLTCSAVDRLVSAAPEGSTGVLLNLGDMFHADNQKNVTASGHQLDVDGRWAKVQQVGLRAKIHCIRRMLEKHQRVIVRINKGNHDGHSSYALALMLSCYFHDDPRVEVDLSPSLCWYFQFGKVLLGSTHGDTIKGKDMLAVMAADKPVEWGQTTHRYWYVGHVHHKDVKEYPGGLVEYVRTLAARDAWHQGQGYRAGRDMQLIVHHREHGEIERHRCDVGMLA
jgi:hypothetical protein